MSFDKTNGTRGASQPGIMMKLMNKMAIGRIRKSGKMMGVNSLVLTTVGAKSGLERVTPVMWFDGGNGSWLIVASAGGAAKNPAWYYNLAANPNKVQIDVAGSKVHVNADQIIGAERATQWQTIVAAAPRFAGYQSKTDREIPIIRLTPQTT